MANGDFPVVTALQAAGPSAGTSLDGTGQGTAFAANPYPGTTAAQLPGVAAGLTGLPIPSYPLFVATTTDDAPADYENPGVALHAKCQNSAKPGCDATSLAGSGTTKAHASIVQVSADEVVAAAEADTSSFSLPGDVTLSGAHTAATAVLKDGKLSRRSALTVSRLSIGASQAFTLDDGKVLIAGTNIPVPFSELASALKAAGVGAEFFAASQSKDGIVAPALRLTTVLPGGPAVVSQPSQVVYTVGGADASVRLGGFRIDTAPITPTTDSSIAEPPAARNATGGSTGLAPVGVVSAPQGSSPVVAPGTAPAALTDPFPVVHAAPASRPTQPFDVADIYLALVLSAAVWFGATQAIRIFGVRFQWTS